MSDPTPIPSTEKGREEEPNQPTAVTSADQRSADPPNKPDKRQSISPRSRVLICAGLFAYLSSWAGLIGNLGNWFWVAGAVIMVAASAAFAAGVRLELRNHHLRKWQYNSLSGTLMLIGLIMPVSGIVSVTKADKPYQPTFTFYLSTSNAPEDLVGLTNTLPNDIESMKSVPILLVPCQEGQTNFELHLMVQNRSPRSVSLPMFFLQYSKPWTHVPDNDWGEAHAIGASNYEISVACYRSTREIHPGDGTPLPGFTLSGPSNQYFDLTIITRVRDTPPIVINLALCFLPPSTAHFSKPVWGVAALQHSPAGTLIFTIPKPPIETPRIRAIEITR